MAELQEHLAMEWLDTFRSHAVALPNLAKLPTGVGSKQFYKHCGWTAVQLLSDDYKCQ